ncbi:MAG: pentapeptide repeat-containing protein, partial [Pseudomonadota bacterium]
MNIYAPPPPKPRDNGLEHIAAITQNARASWLGLLALLVFVGVTLLGHHDRDFFAYGAETQLPLVGVAVPTEAFFWTAPILTAALYCYLHLYLLNLWEALAKAPARIGGERLSDRVPPSLITTAALIYRNWRRGDGCHGTRPLSIATVCISFLLVWGFGWIILSALWIRSMPLHDQWMTLLIGFCFYLSLEFGRINLTVAVSQLWDANAKLVTRFTPMRTALSLCLMGVIGVSSWAKTEGAPFGSRFLSRANLVEAELTEKPDDWRAHSEWMADYLAVYCARNGIPLGPDTCLDDDKEFQSDARIRRRARIDSLDKLSLEGRDLRNAYLTGADLRRAQMKGAAFGGAQMEGAYLSWAQMEGADLSWAQMEWADLSGAQMNGADLTKADMDWAKLIETQMRGAILVAAQMNRASLNGAQFNGANLASVQMKGASLDKVQMEDADLNG